MTTIASPGPRAAVDAVIASAPSKAIALADLDLPEAKRCPSRCLRLTDARGTRKFTRAKKKTYAHYMY